MVINFRQNWFYNWCSPYSDINIEQAHTHTHNHTITHIIHERRRIRFQVDIIFYTLSPEYQLICWGLRLFLSAWRQPYIMAYVSVCVCSRSRLSVSQVSVRAFEGDGTQMPITTDIYHVCQCNKMSHKVRRKRTFPIADNASIWIVFTYMFDCIWTMWPYIIVAHTN